MNNGVRTAFLAGAGVLMVAGIAIAQVPPTPEAGAPPAGEATPQEEMHGGQMRGDMGPHGRAGAGMHAMMMAMHGVQLSRAAHFRFRKGDAMVDIKCADEEPTKACVDAGSALLDKLAAQPK